MKASFRNPTWSGGRSVRALAATAAAIVAVPAVAAPAAYAQNDDRETLTIAVSQEVDSLSPFLGIRVISNELFNQMYDQLTNWDPQTGEVIGGLAESWEASQDGLTWTFHLREDSVWSDGEPVTAEDVVWTFEAMMTDEAAATANGNYVENFEAVTALDPHTVEIAISEPQVTMLGLAVPIVPAHIWRDVDDFATFNNDQQFPVVGNGPFILTEFQVNEFIRLEANEDFRDGRPGFDELVFRYYNDQDAMVEALRRGEVSLVHNLTPAQAAALENEPDITVNAAGGKRFAAYTVNPGAEARNGEPIGDGHPALQDQAVRQALMHTLDRETLFEVVYGGYGEPNGGYIPSRYDQLHWTPSGADEIAFDLEEANLLLDEAGYEPGDDGVRVSPDGDRLSFRFHVHANDPHRVQTGEFMREWAAEAGIELQVEPVDEVGSLLDAGTYDLLTTGWGTGPDPDGILALNLCDARPAEPGATMSSDAFFCDERYDELYYQQRAELDVGQRAALINEMDRILYQSGVFVILGYPDALEAYRTDQIGSIQPQPDPGGNLYNQDGYWAYWSAQPAGGDGSGGGNAALVAVVIVGLVLVLGAAGLLLMRRRAASAEDRE